jgi:uncharacterized protein YciI
VTTDGAPAAVSAEPDLPTHKWIVLMHRPGPAVPAGTDLLTHRGMSEHFAFLRRRQADGTLVAAGPLVDGSGEGLTVLATATLDEAQALAELDDQSVEQGVLAVAVRPWHVVMSPGLLS